MARLKYGNKKTVIDEIVFDSKAEAKRYTELKLLVKAGEITNLELQKPFELIPKQKLSSGKTERACKYLADFVYSRDDKVFVEDTKGVKTQVYLIKKKLMLFIHGIEIIEV